MRGHGGCSMFCRVAWRIAGTMAFADKPTVPARAKGSSDAAIVLLQVRGLPAIVRQGRTVLGRGEQSVPYERREVDIHHLGRALTETALDQPALFREGVYEDTHCRGCGWAQADPYPLDGCPGSRRRTCPSCTTPARARARGTEPAMSRLAVLLPNRRHRRGQGVVAQQTRGAHVG